jgi:Ricin-type beta-trefoil lectin domain-like
VWRHAAAFRGRRRAQPRTYRVLPVALGIAVLGIGAMAGPSVVGNRWNPYGSDKGRERITYAALPADARDQGLVYDGLKQAGAGSLCAGSFELGPTTCTHGPDLAPAGLKVRRSVAPVTARAPEPVAPTREADQVPTDAEVVRDEGGTALTPGAPALIPDAAPGEADFVMGTHNVACEGDGRTGKRVQALYLHEFGTPSRYTDFLGSMQIWAAGADAIFDASAAETGGSRHLRFVTTPQCRVDVAEVQVPEGALDSFSRNIEALQTLGYDRTDRKYLIFADTHVYCGIGTYIADKRPGLGNRNNGGPSYGRMDAGCWGSVMAAHELTDTLGAVLQGSPNSSGGGSCTDDYDLLCGKDHSGATVRTVCPRKQETRLDCGHDDYFNTNPKPGSYLARNWDVAQSEFLLRSDGGDDIPDVPDAQPDPDAPATPSAAPTTAPPAATPPTTSTPDSGATGDPSPSAPPTTTPAGAEPAEPAQQSDVATTELAAQQPVQAVLEVRDPTSTSVRLTWSAAAPKATYDVAVDGAPIATTVATRARLIGLKPDTSYQITIRDSADHYLARSAGRTSPAARPAQNSWFVLTNSLTGGAADLYAARTADGTPITLSESDGDAQEQWRLVPAGASFALQSRATGKCVVPLGGHAVAGTPLVQGDCGSDDGRRWSLQASDDGFKLRTTVGDLVAGVGTQRFGANRILVLQNQDTARHQSWTAVPG